MADGSIHWYLHDKLHREDDPGIVHADDKEEFFFHGKPILHMLTARMIADRLGGVWSDRWVSELEVNSFDKQGNSRYSTGFYTFFGNFIYLKIDQFKVGLEVEPEGNTVKVRSHWGFRFKGHLFDPTMVKQITVQVTAHQWTLDDILDVTKEDARNRAARKKQKQ